MLAKDADGWAKNITPKRENRRSALAGAKGIDGRICERELDLRAAGGQFTGTVQHRLRNIDADDTTTGTNPLHKIEGCRSAAAAHIDHHFPSPDGGPVKQDLGNRRQHDVLALLAVCPMATAGAVPVGDLIGILVGGRQGHRGLRSFRFSSLGQAERPEQEGPAMRRQAAFLYSQSVGTN